MNYHTLKLLLKCMHCIALITYCETDSIVLQNNENRSLDWRVISSLSVTVKLWDYSSWCSSVDNVPYFKYFTILNFVRPKKKKKKKKKIATDRHFEIMYQEIVVSTNIISFDLIQL